LSAADLNRGELIKEYQEKNDSLKKNMKYETVLPLVLLTGLSVANCSQTAAPEPNLIQRATGETPAAPLPTGFWAITTP
jgi:hypothetical protein